MSSTEIRRTPGRLFVSFWIVIAIVLVAIGGVYLASSIAADPEVPLLVSENGAKWIRFRAPMTLQLRPLREFETQFRTKIRVDETPKSAVLTFRSMKTAQVFLDDDLVFETGTDLSKWKVPKRVELAPQLTAGEHDLRFVVRNVNGPQLLLVHCDTLDLLTGDGSWKVNEEGKGWTQAQRADRLIPTESSRKFLRPADTLVLKLYIVLPAFFLVFFWAMRPLDRRPKWLVDVTPKAQHFRWMLLGAWVILAANNIARIPFQPGFDGKHHMNYIVFIVENHRLPLASDGWQMFQAPLFYILAAIPYAALQSIYDVEALTKILRFIPMLCGAAQIEICYRALRHAFPKRDDLQIAGTALGGLLPMNIYMSQFVGNEPLAALFTGMVVLLTLRILSNPAHDPRTRDFCLIGLMLGLAVLSKVTAILLVPILAVVTLYAAARDQGLNLESLKRAAINGATVFGTGAVVSGWYFIRNLVHLGKPFIGGWDPVREIVWWQNPGYRTPHQFYAFGESLVYPVYSGAMGLLDSLYSTLWLDSYLSALVEYMGPSFWDYRSLVLGTWLGIMPTVLILFGALFGFARPAKSIQNGVLFSTACLLVYFAAIAYLFLMLPIYSTAKASYTLGLASCYAVLGMAGVTVLGRRRWLRAVIYGFISMWAVNAYLTYFAV